jgi:hypothetical protein
MDNEREEYFRRMQFEHELINRRLTWLITSQALLFAAYGLSVKEPKASSFLKTIAVVGLVSSSAVLVGIVAGLLAKYCIWKDYKDRSRNKDEEFWVRTRITVLAFLPDLVLPIVFAGAWGSLLW